LSQGQRQIARTAHSARTSAGYVHAAEYSRAAQADTRGGDAACLVHELSRCFEEYQCEKANKKIGETLRSGLGSSIL
jgi:hypothetical protein